MRSKLLLLFAIVGLSACSPPAPAKGIQGGVIAQSGDGKPGGAQPASATDPACFKRSSQEIGGPFHLVSHTGAPTTEASFHGRKTLVFMGYTNCPDVCPTALFDMGKAISLMPPGKPVPRTAFISVDPARDTPEQLARYIESNGFPKDIIGLTGTMDELQQVADGFKTSFGREEDDESTTGYMVSHPAIIYLMDENWHLKTFFRPGESPQTIANCLAAIG